MDVKYDKDNFKIPKKENFTKELLKNLLYSIEDITECIFDRKAAYRHVCKMSAKTRTYHDYNYQINHLKNRGYVKFERGDMSVKFTNKAKMKVVDKLSSKIKADDLYRFVSFDIPEPMKTCRNKFRKLIKNIGFIQIQKSLWVIDKEIGSLVELAAYECRVEKYVIYLVSSYSDIDGIIKKKLSK